MLFRLNISLRRRVNVDMKRTVLFASLVVALATGCGKKPPPTPASPGPETTEAQPATTDTAKAPESPGGAPVPVPDSASATENKNAAPTEPTADLNRLTIQLRTWMMNTRSGPPRNFDAWAAQAHIQVAPPPAGKKYAITKSAWVVLVDK